MGACHLNTVVTLYVGNYEFHSKRLLEKYISSHFGKVLQKYASMATVSKKIVQIISP